MVSSNPTIVAFSNLLLKRADMLKLVVFLFALVAVKADNHVYQPSINTPYGVVPHQQQDAPQVVEAKQFQESIDSFG